VQKKQGIIPDVDRYPRYRWVVLGAAWLTLMSITFSRGLIPSLAYYLIPELDLTQAQFTLLITGPSLTACLTAIPGGALGDRYGIRSVVAVAAFLAGVSSLARAFTPSFSGMFTLMCLFGISFGLAMPNLPKLVSIWFPPRQVGLASGIYATALGTGLSLGLLTGPLFGGWKQAFIYAGMLILPIAILWTLFARNAPKGIEIHMSPITSGIKRGARSKNIWLAGVMMFINAGVLVALSGNLPNALYSVHHVDPAMAGFISSLFTGGVVTGHLLISIPSDRIGLRKPFIYFCEATSAICLFFAWRLAPTPNAQILFLLGGFVLGGVYPLIFALPAELPEIGHEHAGGASGIVMSLSNMGGFLIPLVVMSPLVAAGTLKAYTTGFSVILLLLAANSLVAIFLTETGTRARSRER